MRAPGIYNRHELSNEAYHADTDYLSSSGVKLIDDSLAHFYAKYIAKNSPVAPEKAAFTIGSATHAAVLEPDVFTTEFIREPKLDKRTKAGKEEAAAFAEKAKGKTILTADDFDLVIQMRDMINENPLASQIVQHSITEQSFFFRTDDDIGEKCRTDIFKPAAIADIKTVRSALPYDFVKDAAQYKYFMSGAFYLDVVHQLTGDMPAVFAFIAVEKEPPHAINVFTMKPGDDTYHFGRKQYLAALDKYRHARDAGKWHELIPLELPRWMKEQAIDLAVGF